MPPNQRITEISGKPAKVWGNILTPSTGTISVKIMGDTLHATLISGMEKTESWVRIKNIDTIEVTECPEYLLLALGGFLVIFGLGCFVNSLVTAGLFLVSLILLAGGIACIVLYLTYKRRLLVFYTVRYTLPVFMTKAPSTYQQFAEQVIMISRHLNSFPAVSQSNSRATNQRTVVPSTKRQQPDTP